jgi:Tfp pilus assembly protein PilF
MNNNDISKLVEFADRLVYEKTGQHLETVEKDILQQTLSGRKLSGIQSPSYEDSYVQRFRAPKLWNLLSVVTGERVRKKTVLEILSRLVQERSLTQEPSTTQFSINDSLENQRTTLNNYTTNHHSANSNSDADLNSNTDTNGYANLNSSTAYLQLTVRNSSPENGTGTQSDDSTAEPHHAPDQSGFDDRACHEESLFNRLINLLKPGIPLFLSFGLLSFLFGLSWVANWLGVRQHQVGQLSQAQTNYRWAYRLNPLSASTHYNQATLYEDQHNYDRAQAEYQKAIENGLTAAYNNQARLHILQGNYEAAITLLQSGMPLAENDQIRAAMYKNRGWARLEQKRYAEATLDLQQAIHLNHAPNADRSTLASAYCLLAQVKEQTGNSQAALAAWENCLGFAYQSTKPEEDRWLHLARQRLDSEER